MSQYTRSATLLSLAPSVPSTDGVASRDEYVLIVLDGIRLADLNHADVRPYSCTRVCVHHVCIY